MKNISLLFVLSFTILGCNEYRNKNIEPDESIDVGIRNETFLKKVIVECDTIQNELYETQFYSSYDSICFNRNRIKNNRNLHKISSAIPTNHEIIYFKESDLNTDKIPDLIVVTERDKNQEGILEELQNSLTLYLFNGKKDGSFQLASFNTRIVLPSLNNYDRTFIGVDCFEGGFKVLHYHGTNNWWGISAKFVFDKNKNDWFLTEQIDAHASYSNPGFTVFTKLKFPEPIIPFDLHNKDLLSF